MLVAKMSHRGFTAPQCIDQELGPNCSSDDDCKNRKGCDRCARQSWRCVAEPDRCVSNQRGPRCDSDKDCNGFDGCKRCATATHTCTDQDVPEPDTCVPGQKGPRCDS